MHGEAKTQHGLRRVARRGLWDVAIQAYLTAAVMNLKRLTAFCHAPAVLAWDKPRVAHCSVYVANTGYSSLATRHAA